jgi:hypothetical protein
MAAGINAPFGLYPAVNPGGHAQINRYYAASDAAAIGIGVLVKTDGGVVSAGVSNSTNILGVTAAFVSSAKPVRGLHPTRLKEVLVYDDPSQEFLIQANSTNQTDERDYVNANFSLLNASTFNTTTLYGKATMRVETRSYLKATVAAPRVVQCVGVGDVITRNDYNSSYGVYRVKINDLYHVRAGRSTLT